MLKIIGNLKVHIQASSTTFMLQPCMQDKRIHLWIHLLRPPPKSHAPNSESRLQEQANGRASALEGEVVHPKGKIHEKLELMSGEEISSRLF